MNLTNLLTLFFVLISFKSFSQNKEQLIARSLKAEKEFRYQEALDDLEIILKNDSADINVLNHASFLLSVQNYPSVSHEVKAQYYLRGKRLAERVIKLKPANASGHYNLALALGRLSEYAPIKFKINNAKLIKHSAEKAIQLDPSLAGPYHILGHWHRVVAGFNSFEKAMISTLYGKGLEGGTYNESIANFQKAINLEPFNLAHYYETAITYYQRDEKNDISYARAWLKKTMQIKPRNADDSSTLKKANELYLELAD